jgi:hypothetical protein
MNAATDQLIAQNLSSYPRAVDTALLLAAN